jgi:hypothetical protein
MGPLSARETGASLVAITLSGGRLLIQINAGRSQEAILEQLPKDRSIGSS